MKTIAAIRYADPCNDWMDCVVMVPVQCESAALTAMTEAVMAWHDDDAGMTYGDAITHHLSEENIPCSIIFVTDIVDEPDDDSWWDEEPDWTPWENFLKVCHSTCQYSDLP